MSVANQNGRLADLTRGVYSAIRFSPQFTNRICESLPKSAPTGADIAGLLFGHVEPDLTDIQIFKPFPEAAVSGQPPADIVEDLLAACRSDPEAATLELIGWYAFRSSSGLRASDLAFHNLYLRRANGIALILRPEQHPIVLFEIYSNSGPNPLSPQEHLSGSLRFAIGPIVTGPIDVTLQSDATDDRYLRAYEVSKALDSAHGFQSWLSTAAKSTAQSLFRQRRKIVDDQEPVQLAPLARAAAASAESSPFSPSAALRTAQPSPSLTQPASPPRKPAAPAQFHAADAPVVPAASKPRKLGLLLLSSILIAALAAIATFAFLFNADLAPKTATAPGPLLAIVPAAGLGLQAQEQGDRVLLTWNRANSVVRSSHGGILHIDDGLQHRDVPLDTIQIQNGSVLYHPGSDDVSFRLEVQGQQGPALVETMRVLDGAKTDGAKTDGAKLAAAETVPPQEENLPPDFATRPSATRVPVAPWAAAVDTQDLQSRFLQETRVKVPVPRPAPKPPATSPNDFTKRALANSVMPPTLLSAETPPPRPATETVTPPSPQPLSTPIQIKTEEPKPSTLTTSIEKIAPPLEPRTTPPSAPPPSFSKAIPQKLPESFLPPRPIRQVAPDLKQFGTSFAISTNAQIDVVVKVNSDGRVTEAHLVNKGKVPPPLAFASLAAAKQWIFTPATLDGKKVASFHTITFDVRPAGR